MSFLAKTCLLLLLCGFAFVVIMAAFPAPAHAAGNPDAELAQKKGLEGLFAGKGVDDNDPRLAKPWQKYLAWASIVVTIIVWKFL